MNILAASKLRLALTIFAVSASGLLPFSRPVSAAERVRLSFSNLNVAFLTAGVAAKRGFYKDENLDVELIRMNANVSVLALSNGDIDYTMVIESVIRGALRGLPMKVIASFMDSSTHLLLASPGYKSLKDLKGKVLGVSSFGATADTTARSMFRQSGVDPERELKIVALGPDGARLAALKEGIVDVIVTSSPTDHEAMKMGFNVIARAHELVRFPFTGFGTNTKKLREKPDEVRRMIRAGIRANHYVRQNREGTIQVLMDWGRTDRESATATYDSTKSIFSENGSISESGLKLVIDQNKHALKMERRVSFDEVADFAPLRMVQRVLGIRP